MANDTDLMGVIVVGIIAVYCIASNYPGFLDAGMVLALIAFLGTVAFAKYIERDIRADIVSSWPVSGGFWMFRWLCQQSEPVYLVWRRRPAG